MTHADQIILVAFDVTGAPNFDAAERHLRERLCADQPVREEYGQPYSPMVDSWWVAEDDRKDGSDCDSAVFVSPGRQEPAAALLHTLNMTPDCNLVTKPDAACKWDVGADTNAPTNEHVPNGAVYAGALRIVLQAAEHVATRGETDNPGYEETQAALALLDGNITRCLEITLEDEEDF